MRVAFYLPDLAGGGAERLTLILCDELHRRGYDVELVVDNLVGDNKTRLSSALLVKELLGENSRVRRVMQSGRYFRSARALIELGVVSRKPLFSLSRVVALSGYLEARRPEILVSALGYTPFIAYWANELSGKLTRVIHAEHNTPSKAFLADRLPVRRLIRLNQIKQLVRYIYPDLSAIVAVSDGVASDTAEFAQIERRRITTIYNPIPVAAIRESAAEEVDHPWLNDSQPVLLTAGRLVAQKNFPLLLESLSRLQGEGGNHPRLIILGDGPLRAELTARIRQLGLSEQVDMPGWHPNPYAFMSRADVFVQSSDREGLSTVLIEALACECPVVATDCQSGPREILDDGKYGRIVPTHDADALAEAIAETLSAPPANASLLKRANEFSVDRSVDAYTALFRRVVSSYPSS